MPLSACVFYLESKYKHEMLRDVYKADMLRFAAFGMLEERDRPPRYWDVVKGQKLAENALKDYDEQDVVDMFRGEGHLMK